MGHVYEIFRISSNRRMFTHPSRQIAQTHKRICLSGYKAGHIFSFLLSILCGVHSSFGGSIAKSAKCRRGSCAARGLHGCAALLLFARSPQMRRESENEYTIVFHFTSEFAFFVNSVSLRE